MSQADLGNPTSPLSGTAFFALLLPWRSALHSNHAGNTRPGYIEAGGTWIKNTTNPWILYMFDGSNDISLGTFDVVANTFTPAGVNQNASAHIFDPTGLTYALATNVQDAIEQIDAKLVSLNSASGKVDFAGMAAEASISVSDYLLLNDVSESSGANNKMLVTDLLKVVNALTEDTAPDLANDFLLSYDASAGTCKKVRLNKVNGVSPVAVATPSGVSSVNFSSIFAADKSYDVYFDAENGVTNGPTLYMRVAQTGTTWLTAQQYYFSNVVFAGSVGGSSDGGSGAVQYGLSPYGISFHASGTINFINPQKSHATSNMQSQVHWQLFHLIANSGTATAPKGGGFYNVANCPISGFQMYFATGNISGRFAVYERSMV